MKIPPFNFQTLNWNSVPKEQKTAESGTVFWRTKHVGEIRVRMVEYGPGYKSDHWCNKGHVILVVEGEMDTELKDGRVYRVAAGMCYFVGDDSEPHRSSSLKGCRLFIVD